ncbi:MAG: hypothetical protein GC179_02075 [Anaerolineaceae bacterium]|nr:hypothetical protein [Anaerolineaceae bacterium]
MPNGGLTPDCVHCKYFRGRPYTDENPYCEYHKINLAYQIRVFCSQYINPEQGEDNWLGLEVDLEQLQSDMMYLWLGGYEVKFFYVPLISITEYQNWTSEKFLDELEKLSEKYRGS